MVWARSSTSQALASNVDFSANLLAGFETAYDANLIGATVIRIRGLIAAEVTTVDAVWDELRFGARVGSSVDDAAVVNPTSVPHEDWMLWEPFGAFAVGNEGGAAIRVIDVKAMRKIEEIDQQLTMTVSGFTTAAWQFGWSLSILLKLP